MKWGISMNKLEFENYRKKVVACFLGKSIGGTLGGPYEGQQGPLSLEYYDPVPEEMLPNDDLDLQVAWLENIRRNGLPVNRRSMADSWLENIHNWPDEYGVAYRNLIRGLYPPLSGSYDNKFTAGMGAAIRSEIWACLAPGDPELAVALAREDACVDHDGEGLYAALYLAALESMAFISSDREKLLNKASQYIPENCRVAQAIADARKWWNESGDWLDVRNKLVARHTVQNWTDVAINLSFIILGWLAGDGDYGKAICTAVNCGYDTDCTGATLGALLGIIDPESIEEKWLEPIGRDLVLSPGMVGMHNADNLDTFCNQLIVLAEEVLNYYNSAVSIKGLNTNKEPELKQAAKNMSQELYQEPEFIMLTKDYSNRESLVAVKPLIVKMLYSDEVVFYPEKETEITVRIINPVQKIYSGRLQFGVPDGWSIDKEEVEIDLNSKEEKEFNLNIKAPAETALRTYKNMLDFNFTLNGLQWTVSAGLPQSIPWVRINSDDINLEEVFSKINDGENYQRVEASGHYQEIPAGRYTYLTRLKIPYRGVWQFATQGTRKMRVFLDGELVNEYDGNFYVPAMHRNKTGVNLEPDRGWHQLAIEIEDGPVGELFFGIGHQKSGKWLNDLEWCI